MHSDSLAKTINIAKYAGIDLGDRTSRLCLLDDRGFVVGEETIKTTPTAFAERFHGCLPLEVALEVGSHSRWVQDLLCRCGHVVTVANARQIPLISNSDKKTDRQDAKLLARLLRADRSLLRPIIHRSEDLQSDLALLHAREQLVHVRTRWRAPNIPNTTTNAGARRRGAHGAWICTGGRFTGAVSAESGHRRVLRLETEAK